MIPKNILCLFLLMNLLHITVSSPDTKIKGQLRKTIIKELQGKVSRLEAQMQANRLLMCGVGMQQHVTLPPNNRNIQNRQITASSYWGDRINHAPFHGRLFSETGHAGCWVAARKDENQWIQVDLKKDKIIYGVATQGRPFHDNQWVTSYTVWYQPAGSSFQRAILDDTEQPMVFRGNIDKNTPVTHKFPRPIAAQIFRLKVLTWLGHISMRFDLLTC